MKYISTRGRAEKMNFEEVLLQGLASDGGLYVPETIPQFTPAEIASMKGLTYPELAKIIMQPYLGETFPDKVWSKIVDDAYSTFTHKATAPLKQIGDNEWILELFHGPTLAFKDFALQLLGRMLDEILKKRKEKVVILGATSGDTGSAAIEGCKHTKNADIFILHPDGRTSDIQRMQMTTVDAKNVHNVAIKGTFDDCQNIVKEIFSNRKFLNRQLVAVNSINWARIMAQIVYYFYAALQLGAPAKQVSFSVPTGNFGDIFAGYMAYRMGLPVKKLIIATNENDILNRFVQKNDYSKKKVVHTLSPSMDIQISSNFERMLFYANDEKGFVVSKLMDDFRDKGKLSVTDAAMSNIKKLFASHSTSDKETCETMYQVFQQTGETLDPHTATGVSAARALKKDIDAPMIVLATAHPAKFPEGVVKARLDPAEQPEQLKSLKGKKESFEVLPKNTQEVKDFILRNV